MKKFNEDYDNNQSCKKREDYEEKMNYGNFNKGNFNLNPHYYQSEKCYKCPLMAYECEMLTKCNKGEK